MSNSFYTIRNYQPADFETYVQLIAEAEKLEPTGRCTSPQVLNENFRRPGYSPEQDLFVAETEGNIVGYLDIIPELSIRRAILNCFIHPDHRRKGLATKLLGCALHRAKELGLKIAHISIAQYNVAAKTALSRQGFRFVRRFLQMRLDMTEVHWQDNSQSIVEYRSLQRGEEDKLTQIQNRSFADSWGYNPNTVEEIIYSTTLTNSSPEDVILAFEGDKVVGYCWTGITRAGKPELAKRKGQIRMLGVEPDYRGRGIGKGILLAGLAYLENKHLRFAELTVDSGDKIACALYRSIGFKTRSSNLWYEKAID